MTEFVPSLRLLVAFQQRPELFQAFRNANRVYFIRAGRTNFNDDKYANMADARHELHLNYPTLFEEIKAMEWAWDRIDQEDLDNGEIY